MAPKVTDAKAPGNKKGGFIKGVKSEWKKIVWPTKEELIKYSITVIIISIIVAAIVWGMDKILRYLLSFIIR